MRKLSWISIAVLLVACSPSGTDSFAPTATVVAAQVSASTLPVPASIMAP